MQQRRPAGMTDVARLANVSHQTVSRVLNDHPSVRPSTRERVLAAMAELDYRPNRLARALVTARSGLLGVVTSGSARYGPASTLMAVEEAARASGYAVHVRTLSTAAGSEASNGAAAEVMSETLMELDSQAVEAVVVIAPRISVVHALDSITSRAPLVLIAAGVRLTDRYDAVGVDQYAGSRALTRHLVESGHRRIGYLAGPSDWFDARERLRGWRDELASTGLEPGELWTGDWTAARGYEVGCAVAESADRPTAIVAANDQMALGLLRAFGEAGVDVPGEVAIAGFDDIEGTAYFRPPLTTVRQDFAALARLAIDRVVARLDGDSRLTGAVAAAIVPELVVRASTGASTS